MKSTHLEHQDQDHVLQASRVLEVALTKKDPREALDCICASKVVGFRWCFEHNEVYHELGDTFDRVGCSQCRAAITLAEGGGE